MVLAWHRKNGYKVVTTCLPNELLQQFVEDQSEETQKIYQNILTEDEKKKMAAFESQRVVVK